MYDQETGPSNKSKEGTKNRKPDVSLTLEKKQKQKKPSAILKPSPILLIAFTYSLFQVAWYKQKPRSTNTHATAKSLAFSIQGYINTLNSEGRSGVFFCYAQDSEYIRIRNLKT